MEIKYYTFSTHSDQDNFQHHLITSSWAPCAVGTIIISILRRETRLWVGSGLFKVNGTAGTQTQVFLAPKLCSSSAQYNTTSGRRIRLKRLRPGNLNAEAASPGAWGYLGLLEGRKPENLLRDSGTYHFGFANMAFTHVIMLGFLGSSLVLSLAG